MNTIPVLPDHVIFTDFKGAEGVLLDLNTHQYFKLNETGTLVWRTLETGCSLAEVVAALTHEYQVTEEDAATSIQTLCEKLASHGLLEMA
ncbi:MAG: PqqD family protein [Blastocatellia bacterium]|nr:PqqD family protein [Blastocatellia bacterium]